MICQNGYNGIKRSIAFKQYSLVKTEQTVTAKTAMLLQF